MTIESDNTTRYDTLITLLIWKTNWEPRDNTWKKFTRGNTTKKMLNLASNKCNNEVMLSD